MSNRATPSSGFTLLEVLVALVILGLGVAFLAGTISDSLMRAQRIDGDDRATALADATLARLGNDIPLLTGVTRGETDGLCWRLTITPQLGVTSVPLDNIEFTVSTPSARIIGQWQTLRVAAQADR